MRLQLTPEAYRKIAFCALASLVLITITGAAVRLTESGLGCSDWPTCEENKLVPDFTYHALIEFVNRMITGVVSVAVVAAALGSYRRTPRRSDLTRLSWLLVIGVPMNAVLGAIVVFTELNPWAVLTHFLLAIVLIWVAVVLLHRAGIDDDIHNAESIRAYRPHAWVITTLASITIVLGTLVTGSGPHTGNYGGELIERLPFDVGSIARIHGISVVVLLGAVISTLVFLRRHGDERETKLCTVLLGILLAQALVGYVQYFTGVPALLVGIHVAGAVSVWIAVLWFHLNSKARPIKAPEVKKGLPASAALAQ